jgi:hypothetical protein
VDALDTVRLDPLPLDHTLLPHLLKLNPRLPFDPLRARLLTLNPGLALDPLRPRLLTLNPSLALDALRARLLTLDPSLALDPLRTRLLALGALRALRTLERGELLTLHAGRALHLLATATAAVHLRGLLVLASAIVRPRIRRGCDRQRGHTGCEKNPGHSLSPLNGKNGPFAAPFQRLNGWNLHITAPG